MQKKTKRALAYQLATTIPQEKLNEISGGLNGWSISLTARILLGMISPDFTPDR